MQAVFDIMKLDVLGSDSIITGIERARESGFKTAFRYERNKLIDRETGKSYRVENCDFVGFERFEGMSDPSDSSILFLIKCSDGNKGFVAGAYGIYADTELFDFIQLLKNKKEIK